MIKITHITQSNGIGCVSACLAMLLDLPLEKVMQEFHEDYMAGKTHPLEYVNEKIDELGLKMEVIPFNSYDTRIQPGLVYFLTVPSLTTPGIFHQIILDTQSGAPVVYDPLKWWVNKRYYVEPILDPDVTYPDNEFPLTSWVIDFAVRSV